MSRALTSLRPMRPGVSSFQLARVSRRWLNGTWKGLQPGHAFDQQPVPVDEIEPAARFRLAQPGFDHGSRDKRTDVPLPADPAPNTTTRC